MNRNSLIELAEYHGLYIHTWSPGDGVTRYHFATERDTDYFACRPLYTAAGFAEAKTFLQGWILGREHQAFQRTAGN